MTSDSFLVARFCDLFEGNVFAIGEDHGQCTRLASNEEWTARIAEHLEGGRPAGVYPMRDNKVKWGCLDLDVRSDKKPSGDHDTEEECHIAALNYQRIAKRLGLNVWVERTRSKGRHLFLFSQDWVKAQTMRDAELAVCSIGGISTREVNPKTAVLAEGQIGNYVRVCYPGTRPTGDNRQVILDVAESDRPGSYFCYTVHQFVSGAIQTRCSTADLLRVAALYKPPVKHTFIPQHTPYYGNPQLNALGRHAIEYGPANGDRSSSMAYIAHQAHDSGMAPHDCFELLRNIVWSKYSGRPDEDKRLIELVERAYGR